MLFQRVLAPFVVSALGLTPSPFKLNQPGHLTSTSPPSHTVHLSASFNPWLAGNKAIRLAIYAGSVAKAQQDQIAGIEFAHAVAAYVVSVAPPPPSPPVYSPPTQTTSTYVTPVISGTGSVNGMACGGSLPSCCTLAHESNGQPGAMNPSGAAGLWQFMPGTWNNYAGYASAADAPVSVQNAKAVEVFANGRGASNWYGDGCYSGG